MIQMFVWCYHQLFLTALRLFYTIKYTLLHVFSIPQFVYCTQNHMFLHSIMKCVVRSTNLIIISDECRPPGIHIRYTNTNVYVYPPRTATNFKAAGEILSVTGHLNPPSVHITHSSTKIHILTHLYGYILVLGRLINNRTIN